MTRPWGRSATAGRDVRVERLRLLGVLAVTALTVVLLVIQLGGDRARPGLVPGAVPVDADSVPLSAPAEAKVLFLGDDWTAGEGATLPRGAFPHLLSKELGWQYRIDAVPGSGWAHSAPDEPGSQYLDRAFRLQTDDDFVPDVVVVSAQMVSPQPTSVIRKLMRTTVTTLRSRVPEAVIAVVLPYGNPRGMGMCEPLENDHITCVDTFGEQWLLGDDAPSYFRGGGLLDDDGHAYFAQRLAEDLRRDLVLG